MLISPVHLIYHLAPPWGWYLRFSGVPAAIGWIYATFCTVVVFRFILYLFTFWSNFVLFVFQSFDICGRVSAICKAVAVLCSSQVRFTLILSYSTFEDTQTKMCTCICIEGFNKRLILKLVVHSSRVMEWGPAISSAARPGMSAPSVRLISEIPSPFSVR